ncbi:protein TBATA isoform X30 [Macaca fascicularis]|uniref:protein TBATA isoform X30 n=1 Tax=Macaca fascicularis TaxID=9541 RepID=UPI003D158ABD
MYISPKAKLKPEKKSGRKPRSPGDSRPQKELVIPGIVDFKQIRQALRTPKPQTPGTYCFGRLSHHSFFSRHHPHPQHVTHIQDLTGKPVCVVRDSPAPLPESTVFSGCQMGMPTVSAPIGDPQSNRNPQLSSEGGGGGASAGAGRKVLSGDWEAHPRFHSGCWPPQIPPGPAESVFQQR